jgi:hypothetical protein
MSGEFHKFFKAATTGVIPKIIQFTLISSTHLNGIWYWRNQRQVSFMMRKFFGKSKAEVLK